MKKVVLRAAAICALFLAPAIAEAAEGFATANVNMRSGPSTRYPAVSMIPVGESVEIHGCLADVPWCDVSFYGGRGWVAGRYVQANYRRNRVYVEPQYYRPLGIPTVVFQFDRYWDRNYRGRDFYRDRDRWRRGPDWVDDTRRSRDWERQRDRDRRDWERDRARQEREWTRDQAREQRERDRDRQNWERNRRDGERWDDRAGDDKRRPGDDNRGDWERRRDRDGTRVREDFDGRNGGARPAPLIRCQAMDPSCVE